jgi:hypothetical protein
MKTLVLTTALVVLSTITFAQKEIAKATETKTEAKENVICNLYPSAEEQVTLILRKESGEKLIVKVSDSEGSMVHQKRIKKADDSKITYDISDLPQGTYTFEVIKDKEVVYTQNVRKGEGMVATL